MSENSIVPAPFLLPIFAAVAATRPANESAFAWLTEGVPLRALSENLLDLSGDSLPYRQIHAAYQLISRQRDQPGATISAQSALKEAQLAYASYSGAADTGPVAKVVAARLWQEALATGRLERNMLSPLILECCDLPGADRLIEWFPAVRLKLMLAIARAFGLPQDNPAFGKAELFADGIMRKCQEGSLRPAVKPSPALFASLVYPADLSATEKRAHPPALEAQPFARLLQQLHGVRELIDRLPPVPGQAALPPHRVQHGTVSLTAHRDNPPLARAERAVMLHYLAAMFQLAPRLLDDLLSVEFRQESHGWRGLDALHVRIFKRPLSGPALVPSQPENLRPVVTGLRAATP